MGITIFKMFIWGGISSVMWSEIMFTAPLARRRKTKLSPKFLISSIPSLKEISTSKWVLIKHRSYMYLLNEVILETLFHCFVMQKHYPIRSIKSAFLIIFCWCSKFICVAVMGLNCYFFILIPPVKQSSQNCIYWAHFNQI